MSGPRRQDLTGQKWNMATALSFVRVANSNAVWLWKCDCGNEFEAVAQLVKRGHIKACGCMRGERHGKSYDVEYSTWQTMNNRCSRPLAANYKYYGGRGISVCDRWKNSFSAFYADMGKRPSNAHSIDRVNNDGNYEPGNCRWATAKEQSANKRKYNATSVCGNGLRDFGTRTRVL